MYAIRNNRNDVFDSRTYQVLIFITFSRMPAVWSQRPFETLRRFWRTFIIHGRQGGSVITRPLNSFDRQARGKAMQMRLETKAPKNAETKTKQSLPDRQGSDGLAAKWASPVNGEWFSSGFSCRRNWFGVWGSNQSWQSKNKSSYVRQSFVVLVFLFRMDFAYATQAKRIRGMFFDRWIRDRVCLVAVYLWNIQERNASDFYLQKKYFDSIEASMRYLSA